MRTRSAWMIAAVSLILGIGGARAQDPRDVGIVLRFDGSELVRPPERPQLAPGGTLSIQIVGDSLPRDFATDWSFSLSDSALQSAPAASLADTVHAGYFIVAPRIDEQTYTLSFRDASSAVSNFELQLPRAQTVTQPPPPPPPLPGGIVANPGSAACTRTPAYDRKRNVARLVFYETGLPVQELPRDLDDNDVINICLAIPKGQEEGDFAVQVEGNIRGQGISVLGQGALGDLPVGALQSSAGDTTHMVHLYGTYGPFSSPQITVTVSKVGDQASQRAHVLRINTTYIANLQFGVGISNIRFNDFVLVPDPDSASVKEIRNRAKDKDEARPMLLVGFYGWPWEKEFWNGRDIEEEPTVFNRLNPMVGIGLRETILDEFLAGVTFELTKGLFVFGAVHVAQVDKLQEGFKQNEPLAVALDSVPTREAWQSDFVWGFSVDLRIAASVLKGIVGTP